MLNFCLTSTQNSFFNYYTCMWMSVRVSRWSSLTIKTFIINAYHINDGIYVRNEDEYVIFKAKFEFIDSKECDKGSIKTSLS